jgi:hypothetical protein
MAAMIGGQMNFITTQTKIMKTNIWTTRVALISTRLSWRF